MCDLNSSSVLHAIQRFTSSFKCVLSDEQPKRKLSNIKRDMESSPKRSPPQGNVSSSVGSPMNTPTRRFASPPGSRGRSEAGAIYSDRFIPSRLSTNLEDAFDMLENRLSGVKDHNRTDGKSESNGVMSNLLRSELLGEPSVSFNSDARMDGLLTSPPRKEGSGSNLFKYRSSQGSSSSSTSHHGGSLDSQLSGGSDYSNSPAGFGVVTSPDRRRSLNSPKKPVRKISKTPYKVLDAPSLQDDYYLNLVDWSHANVLSVALGSCVYLWSACTSKVTKLCDLGTDDAVTSISWATTGSQISVGTNSGKILIWDATTCKQVREMAGHDNRVGTMAWSSTLLASGSRDRNIYLQDIRIRSHGSSTGNTNATHNHSANSSTTGVRAYASPGIASPNRYSTGSLMRGGDGSVATMNLSVAMHPPGSIRRSSEGFLVPTSYISPGSDASGMYEYGSTLRSRHSMGGVSSVSLMDTSTDSTAMDTTATDASLYDDFPMPPPRAMPLPPSPLRPSSHGHSSPHTAHTLPNNSLNTSLSSTSTDHSPCLVRELSAHKQEVCGLKWSFDEKMLASGGNDNKLFVWDAGHGRNSEPLCRLEDHTAAVKAVAWSPHQHGLLASGGGTADRHIRFWNALTSTPLHKIDTGSQVCNLMWSKNVNELVSTHGYSLNQVIVWKYPTMQKIATLTGHTLRVLYLAMSPDGQSIVTGAGDETLRFWNVFPGPRSKTGYRIGPSALTPSGSDIR